MAQRLRPLTLPGAAAMAVLAAVLVAFLAPWGAGHHFTDFHPYQVYAMAIDEGYTPYSVPDELIDRWVAEREIHALRGVPDLTYPPLLPMLCIPLTWMPSRWSVRVFSLLSIAAVLVLGLILCQLLDQPRLQPLVFLGLALFGPVYSTLHVGQINNIIAMLIALALWAATRRRFPLAAVAVVLGTMLKILPISLLAWMALRRNWFGVLCATLAAGLILLVTGALFGFEQWTEYATSTWLVERAMQPVRIPTNQSVFGVSWALFPANVGSTAAWAVTAGVGAASVWLIVRGRRVDPDGAVGAAMLITATALVFPLFRDHHQVILAVPLVVVLREAYRLRLRAAGWTVVLLVGASMGFTTWMVEGMIRGALQTGTPPSPIWLAAFEAAQTFPLLQAAAFLGMLLLWGTLAFRLAAGERITA